MELELTDVISQFSNEPVVDIQPLGNGHIHKTWKIDFTSHSIVLQQFNSNIFKNPYEVCKNIEIISDHLKSKNDYPYDILQLIRSKQNEFIVPFENNYFRAINFAENCYAADIMDSVNTAFEVSKAFGKFAKALSDLNPNSLTYSIENFHNGTLRHAALWTAIKENIADRVKYCENLINKIETHKEITKKIDSLKETQKIPLRIAHFDTKVNNILLDNSTNLPKMIIDLDTTMSGTLLSDFGDMVRTATPTKDENEMDLDKVNFDLKFFEGITHGYLSELSSTLNQHEKENLLEGGKYLILMQCERFLADYINGDIYYPIHYENQNLDRANNQMKLLESIIDQESEANQILKKYW
jgi:N-acetylhexosamine 1-kinase